jgi:DHA1 family multidrug resistance protein-like MFS transporter
MVQRLKLRSVARVEARSAAEEQARRLARWRRNLTALCIGQAAAIFGLSFTFPFLPLFLKRELGITDAHQLAIWAGLANAALGVGLFIGGPLWGSVADRFGRKPMLMRAMVAGGVTVFLMGLAQHAFEVVVLRFLFGLFSGTTPIAMSLASADSPPGREATSIGWVSAANATGTSMGPGVSGITAATYGLRATYYLGGLIEVLAAVPVGLFLRETAPPPRRESRERVRFREIITHWIGVLLVSQALFYTISVGASTLVALRIVGLSHHHPALITGITFSVSGACGAISAAMAARTVRRVGYRRAIGICSVGAAGAMLAVGAIPSAVVAVAAMGVWGLTNGTITAALFTMIGLEAPANRRSAVFGFGQSATATGLTIGPLLAGATAAITSVEVGLIATAALALVLGSIVQLRAREPAVVGPPEPAFALSGELE